MALDALHSFVPAFVATSGRVGVLVGEVGRECFIEAHDLPARSFPTLAAACDLPDAHNHVAVLGDANSVNLDNARKTVIAKLKTLTQAQCFAGS